MMVLRVIQILIWLLSAYFLCMAVYYISTGAKNSGAGLYLSLAAAGLIITLLLHFINRALKKHL